MQMHSEAINEIAAALAKAQGEIKGAIKDSTNPHFRSSYADLSSVWEACRGPLAKNGLAVIQMPTMGDGGLVLQTTLTHSSGQWFASYLPIVPTKNDPQGLGSAITYMRRYALAAMVGVAPEDDDGNAASEPNPNAPRQDSARPKAKTAAPRQDEELPEWRQAAERIKHAIDNAETLTSLNALMQAHAKTLEEIKGNSETAYDFLVKRAANKQHVFAQEPAEAAE